MNIPANRYAMVQKGDTWERCEFEQLKKGDIFQLFEPNGTPIEATSGSILIATADAGTNEEGIPMIAYKVHQRKEAKRE